MPRPRKLSAPAAPAVSAASAPDPTVAPVPEAMASAIEDFGNVLTLERGRSNHTLSGYESDLRQCAVWLATHRGVRDWREVTPAQAMDWLYSLGGDRFAVSSLARKLSALRGFARHLVREETRPDDFTALLQGPKRVRRVPGPQPATAGTRYPGQPECGPLREWLSQKRPASVPRGFWRRPCGKFSPP